MHHACQHRLGHHMAHSQVRAQTQQSGPQYDMAKRVRRQRVSEPSPIATDERADGLVEDVGGNEFGNAMQYGSRTF